MKKIAASLTEVLKMLKILIRSPIEELMPGIVLTQFAIVFKYKNLKHNRSLEKASKSPEEV